MNQYIPVENCDLIQVVTQIKINILNIILCDRATIQVLLYGYDTKLLDSYIFELVGDEYQMWQDDNYLIQYVCEKYNLILREPSVPL